VFVSCSRSRGKPRAEPEGSPPESSLGGSSRAPAISAQSSAGGRALRIGELLLLATGIILFVVLLAQLGLDNVLSNFRVVGWGIVLIIVAEILPMAVNTLGWRAAFPKGGRVPSFRQLLLARIAGEAANYLTPTAMMGGEFVRVRMLQEQASVRSLVASALMAKLTQAAGLVIFVIVGLLLIRNDTSLQAGTRWGIFGGMALFATLISGLLLIQRYGLLGPALRLAEHCLALRFLARMRSPIEQVEAEMARMHRESTGRIVLSSVIFAVGFIGGVIECYLILWFFDIPVSLKLALAVEVLTVALNNLMFFVPLRAGTQEAGKALIFAMLGLNPAQGLAAGVICRIRELTWALIGLAILTRSRLSSRSSGSLPKPLQPLSASSPEIVVEREGGRE
jgi:uncharacterized protein (TIRG00374 family)